MASPDERQGDLTATTTCYVCNEISKGRSGAVADPPVLPMDPSQSVLSRKSANVTGEETVAPVAVLPDNTPDPSALKER
jgi:hypothetical protein